jgi:hypothetical protein
MARQAARASTPPISRRAGRATQAPESGVSIAKTDRADRRVPPLDLDTVRVERMPEGSIADAQVMAGPANEPVLVGYLTAKRSVSGSRTRGWIAERPNGTTVPGGLWRTPQAALVHLVDDHLRYSDRDGLTEPARSTPTRSASISR